VANYSEQALEVLDADRIEALTGKGVLSVVEHPVLP